MTPREYIDIVRERWRHIAAGLLLGLLGAVAVTLLMPRQYQAPVTVIVAVQPDADAQAGATDEEISAQRLSTYVELMRSRRLADGVVEELRLPVAPEDLAERISVTTTPDSALLTATVTDGSPDQAVRVANAVADRFISDVAEIEQPADRNRRPPVAAKVFEAAAAPAELVAPRPVPYLLTGLLLGLVAGLGAALLRHALDFRIRTRRQMEDLLGVPVLGTIGRDPKIPSSPLVMYGAPHTPLAEAFRQLRTNVSFLDVDREHKVVLVTSATANEGRSTTVCNLGLAMAEAGSRVLILDADLRGPSIARILGVDDAVGLTDVLVNRIPVERAIRPMGPTLDVLPSGPLPPNPSELLGSNRMVNLLGLLRKLYDVVLIDSAPLLPVTDAAVLAPRVDGVLVVVRHGRTVVQDVQAAKDAVDAVSGRVVGSVLTMVAHTGTRAHARVRTRRGRGRSPSQVLPPVSGASVPTSAPVPTSGAVPQRDRYRGAPVTLGDQRTVMLAAPQPGAQKAVPQVHRSTPQTQRPTPPTPSTPQDVPPPAAQDAVRAPLPAGPPPTLPEMVPVLPADTVPVVPPAAEPDVPRETGSAVPQDAESVVAPDEAQDAPQDEAQETAPGAPHAEGAARNGKQDTQERPAPRPRPRGSSAANGQAPDRDGVTAR